MRAKRLNKIFINIILPAIIAILLYFFSVWLIIIPIMEKNMMESKKEMIRELTKTACSLIDEFHQDYTDSVYSLKEAKDLAKSKIKLMRYGPEGKDYFWITDTAPTMIMHPYRTELIGQNLSGYEDPRGVKLFKRSVEIVDSAGQGYLNYYWQWKDDTSRVVPKLSYVQGFPEWGWIVGTGIYIEDVRKEISTLKQRIIFISLIITGLIGIMLFFIIRQSLHIEKRRETAEDELMQSREKYRSLVEASTEGTMMVSDNNIIYVNQTFCRITGYSDTELYHMSPGRLFGFSWSKLIKKLAVPGKSKTFETKLLKKNGTDMEMIVTASKTHSETDVRVIITTKEPSSKQQITKAHETLNNDLKTALLLMNQPVKGFLRPAVTCSEQTSISSAAQIMQKENSDHLLIQISKHTVGIITSKDLIHRAIARDIPLSSPVTTIMTAPLATISSTALLYDAFIAFSEKGLSHLIIKSSDNAIAGVLHKDLFFRIHKNAPANFISQVSQFTSVSDFRNIFLKVPGYIKALSESGIKPWLMTHYISSVTDAITLQLIKLATESLGNPPCRYAFMVMGSEARKEQSLVTDQDNAIIYDDAHKDNPEVRRYFKKFAEIINPGLNSAGINYCNGEIMAQNPKWNQPLSAWKSYFSKWVNDSDPQSILEAAIFFDFRFVEGDKLLTDTLKDHVLNEVKNKSVFFYHMAGNVIEAKLPPTNKEIDLKKLLMPVTGFARVYSLKAGIPENNTVERLLRIKDKGLIPTGFYNDITDAYSFLMQLRLECQYNAILSGDKPSNAVHPDTLNEFELHGLKKAVSIISDMQTRLSADFKGVV
jgi:PAS domain S-box-containing protein